MRRARFVIRVLIAFAVAATCAVTLRPAGAGADEQPRFADAAGIHVVDAHQVDAREWALDVYGADLGRAVRLRVLLPDGYATSHVRYPVLYLFHGTSGGPDDWFTDGDVEATTAGLPLIVVLPDAGFDDNGGSWFTNWWDQKTALGPSRWESFHIEHLIPFVDADLRTRANRAGRAIAGLSQGGFGAFSLAARHPDMFSAAGSFSGAPDITTNPLIESVATAIIEATAAGLDRVEPAAMFGPHLTNEANWQGHDPAQLVTNLRATNLSLYTASGLPGALDGPTPNPGASTIELLSHVSTLCFAERAAAAHVPYYLDDYGAGTHTFPYWARDLRDFVPRLMDVFAHPSVPSTVSYRSVDQTWTQWGWAAQNVRGPKLAWSELSAASAAGFSYRGSGSATVTTPALFGPNSAHRVAIADLAGRRTVALTADPSGRLHVTVTLHALLRPSGTAAVTIS